MAAADRVIIGVRVCSDTDFVMPDILTTHRQSKQPVSSFVPTKRIFSLGTVGLAHAFLSLLH